MPTTETACSYILSKRITTTRIVRRLSPRVAREISSAIFTDVIWLEKCTNILLYSLYHHIGLWKPSSIRCWVITRRGDNNVWVPSIDHADDAIACRNVSMSPLHKEISISQCQCVNHPMNLIGSLSWAMLVIYFQQITMYGLTNVTKWQVICRWLPEKTHVSSGWQRMCDIVQPVPFRFWRMEYSRIIGTLATVVGAKGVSEIDRC